MFREIVAFLRSFKLFFEEISNVKETGIKIINLI